MRTSFWLPVCLVAVFAACGGGKKKPNGNVDASNPCGVFGASCTDGTTCCSGVCDPSGTCSANPSVCSAAGASCSAGTDCCTVRCENNVCSSQACVADNDTCGGNGECCSGNCSGSKCAPLNPACKTDGNPCGGNGECCSQLCNSAGKCGPSSYCVQDGDACAHGAECCGGECNIATGATLGTCTHPMPGSTLCSAGVDGTVCTDCGSCCSRLCEVYQPTGVKICQPAEGCRVNGDICRTNADCCGAAGTGLPGDGNVTCLKENATDTTGICRNPISCNPEGDVCHYQNYQTCGNSSARNDCCGAPGNSGVCKLDALGVPRCYGLGTGCQMAGQSCAYSGDCCNGAPCVPDSNGNLHCGGSMCQPMGSMCTNDADCCSGTSCVFQPGQTYGTCGGQSMCSNIGQTCNATTPCCAADGSSCTLPDMSTPCPAGQTTGCTCTKTIF